MEAAREEDAMRRNVIETKYVNGGGAIRVLMLVRLVPRNIL